MAWAAPSARGEDAPPDAVEVGAASSESAASPAATEVERNAPKAIEEVVVTGRKREELIQDTPVSIVAITPEDLEIKGITRIDDIGQAVAGLKFDTTTGSTTDSRIYIRGVGQDSNNTEVDPGVGLYLDGVFIPRAGGSILRLADIERVEVLRGPQGTLYGKNTIGGVVNIITRKPQFDYEGSALVRWGNYGRLETQVTANVPLVPEMAAARFSFATETTDGYARNVLRGDRLGDSKVLSGRASFLFNPTDDLEILLTYDQTQQNQNALVGQCRLLSQLALSTFIVANTTNFTEGCQESDAADDFNRFSTDTPKFELDIQGASSTIQLDRGSYTIKSISSWRRVSNDQRGGDIDGTRVPFIGGLEGGRSQGDTFSQEFLLQGRALDDKLFFSTGVYGLRETGSSKGLASISEDVIGDVTRPLAGDNPAPGALTFGFLNDTVFQTTVDAANVRQATALGFMGTTTVVENPITGMQDMVETTAFDELQAANPALAAEIDAQSRQRELTLEETLKNLNRLSRTEFATTSLAGFAEVTYDATDRLSLTGGIRYTTERKSRRGKSIVRFPFDKPASMDRIGVDLSERFDKWTPRVNVAYKATDDILVYSSFARGFRSGGFNDTTATVDELGDVTTFEPDILDSYELGLKTSWLDNRLVLNLTGFYNVYRDIQLTILEVNPETGLPQGNIRNAGRAIVQGLELDFQARPSWIDGLSLAGGVSFINADYKDFKTAILEDAQSTMGCTNLRFTDCFLRQGQEAFNEILGQLANPRGDEALMIRPRLFPNVDVSDRDFKQTPAFSFNVQLNYRFELFNWGTLNTAVQYYHQGKTFQNTANTKATQQPKFGVVNGRIAWELWDSKTTLAVWARNLTDRRYISGALDFKDVAGTNSVFFAPPRTYGIELRRLF